MTPTDMLTADAVDASLAAFPMLIASIASFKVVNLVGTARKPCLLPRHAGRNFVWDTVNALANFVNIDVEGMFDSLEIKVLEELSKRKNGTGLAGQNWRIERHVVDDAVMSNEVAEQS
ncbi:hypothetical protein IW261DRAFT_1417664 [Armillaria novae-zelandiae]|uniref:Uncharacterized protein n=1 Tax=Armillaria novae-zelandiae TaxID=153914 RepID=A0AA39PIK8_9AGAR|nr:hypothetical protein IW261DRAFT_1417664 [Armillaria novae-zelandiae]